MNAIFSAICSGVSGFALGTGVADYLLHHNFEDTAVWLLVAVVMAIWAHHAGESRP